VVDYVMSTCMMYVFLTAKMLSGIANYLFGSTAEDDMPGDSDDVKLTTFPMENEWLLVDRAGMSIS